MDERSSQHPPWVGPTAAWDVPAAGHRPVVRAERAPEVARARRPERALPVPQRRAA